MKSVIVDIKDGFAAVLSDDGCVEKIKDKNYTIGQVIDLKKRKGNISKRLAIIASTAAAFVMLCGAGIWATTSPYSYVSLDVNPSIEFTLNRFDRVLSVSAVNDDGEDILKEIQLDEMKYEKIDEALTKTIDAISKDGYFEDEIEGGIVIATSGEDEQKSEELAEKLEEDAKKAVEENEDEVAVESISVGLERVQEARLLNVTPGKLNLVQKLQATMEDPDEFDTEEWLKKPVKEIMKATKDNRKALKISHDSEVEEEDIDEVTEITVEDTKNEANKIKNQAVEKEKIKAVNSNNNSNKKSIEAKEKSNNGNSSAVKEKTNNGNSSAAKENKGNSSQNKNKR
jgi:hypothetical protein